VRNRQIRVCNSCLIVGLFGLLLLVPFSNLRADGVDSEADHFLAEHGWVIDNLALEKTDRTGVRSIRAEARLRIPAEAAWSVISGEGGSKRWPGLNESVLEWSKGDTTIRRYTLGIPIYPDRHYKLRNTMNHERMQYSFQMVPGYGNVHQIQGNWTVTPLSDSTSRVVYELHTDPGVSLIPGFIVNWATKKAFPRTFAHIYDQACMSRENELELGERID